MSNTRPQSFRGNKFREKITFFLKTSYRKGQLVELPVLAEQVGLHDDHRHCRLVSYLKEYRDELVDYVKGRWVVK